MVKMARLPPQKNIHSDAEMDQFMLLLFDTVIDKVGKEIVKDIQEIIQQEVYDKGSPTVYDRQYKNHGFISAWSEISGRKNGEIVTEVGFRPGILNISKSRFIHGSVYPERQSGNRIYPAGDWDIRESLADIIIKGGTGEKPRVGTYFDRYIPPGTNPWWKLPRDFWTPFLAMLDRGEVDLLIKLELNRMGINLVPA
jgi:hypothetical protein